MAESPAVPSFASLLGDLTVDEFLRRHWTDDHWFNPDAGPAIAGLAELPALRSPTSILGELRSDTLLVMPPALSGEGYGGGIEVRKRDAAGFYAAGMTLWIKRAQDSFPECGAFLGNVARELGLPADRIEAQLWISPPGKGTLAHYDASEVLNVQLRGTKRWQIAPNREIRYPNVDSQIRPKGLAEGLVGLDMTPGSALFLPRGYWHSTQAVDESISLTLFIRSTTWLTLMQELMAARFVRDESWRKPRLGVDPESLHGPEARDDFRAALAQARDFFSEENAADLAALWRKRLAPKPDAGEARFVRAPAVSMAFRPNPGSNGRLLTVEIEDATSVNEVEVPVEFAGILDWLARRDGDFSIADLTAQILAIAPGEGGYAFGIYRNLKVPKVLETFAEMGFLKRN